MGKRRGFIMLAILSDIHGNLEALTAVLDECERIGVKRYMCLGDVIGYGPDPLAVSEIAVDKFPVCLMGNHEEALVTGKHRFNPYAAQAIDWTRQQLEGTTLTRLFKRNHRDFMKWYTERKTIRSS